VVALVEHHLLLSDVATRRDLDDATTIERVAAATGTVERLRLLAALTEADSRATSPAAWSPWKAELVGRLVERVEHVLEGGELTGMVTQYFPTAEELAELAAGGRTVEGSDDVLTVMTDDRPGIFSRVAGVLALHGLDVLSAVAHSTDDGRALARFKVVDPMRSTVPWPRVVADLDLALTGRLAVPARLAERARAYGPRRRQAAPPATTAVCFDDVASTASTVIDVHAPDAVGVLYRITRALAELDLDIRSAKVQTLGHQVVDAFYVRDADGAKITDADVLGEIRRAILHSLSE
jgi:[protein-PII] uridylyltransferase